MAVPTGRRERKKAATRQKIADTAMALFLEQRYDAVGIRDVAAEADVVVTTVFAHFDSKESLVFPRETDLEQRLVRPIGALRHEFSDLVGRGASRRQQSIIRDQLVGDWIGVGSGLSLRIRPTVGSDGGDRITRLCRGG